MTAGKSVVATSRMRRNDASAVTSFVTLSELPGSESKGLSGEIPRFAPFARNDSREPIP
jgi:hypothetical protein